MIYYELAKQLKDVGFPQKGEEWTPPNGEGEQFYLPTLEELIEACGAQYVEDGSDYDFTLSYFLGAWYANYMDQDDRPTPRLNNGIGPTPTEAVARLWLALNKIN